MPSSHAQIIFYAFSIFVLQLTRHRQAYTQDTFLQLGRVVKLLTFLGSAILVAYSRVYLGYHSLLQVVAGAAAGALMAALCFTVTGALAPNFRKLQQSCLGKLLRLKDTWNIPDVLLHEYEHVDQQRNERKSR